MAKHITLTHLKSAVQAVKAYIDAHIKSHTHTRSQITDFPSSMPASDVPSWAKQPAKPSYTKSEVGLGSVPNVTTNDQAPTFTTASSRTDITSGETLSTLFGEIKRWYADLKTVAWTGKYDDLTNKPTIPSAVTVDASLDGTSANPVQNKAVKSALDGKSPAGHKHTKADITDFPASMPASDVSSWAKQSSKPTYTATEIGAAPSSHVSVSVASSDGAHNLRYYSGKLQYKDGGSWKTLSIADLLI